MSENLLEVIHPTDLSGMMELEELSLHLNDVIRLSSLNNNSQWNMPFLKTLDLWGNQLDRVVSFAFLGLDSLTALDLHSNPIGFLEKNALKGLNQLTFLDLSDTNGINLNGALNNVPTLQTLNIRNVLLVGLIVSDFKTLDELQKIVLSDTSLLPAHLFLNNVSLFSGKRKLREIILDDNTSLKIINAETFQNLTLLSLLSINNCGIQSIDQNLLRDLVNLKEISFDMNFVVNIPPALLSNLTHLHTLSARRNSLIALEETLFRYTTALRFITLPYNALTSIPARMFDYLPELEFIDVQGNPLICTCSSQGFSNWLLMTDASAVIGARDTLCSPASFQDLVGKPVTEFVPSDYCGPNIALNVSIVLLVVIFLSSLILSLRYRHWIRYKCFLLKLCVIGYEVLEERNADEHIYILNVMFTPDDEPWVNDHLKPVIREKFPDKDEERDFVFGDEYLMAGMYYPEAVDYAVVNSFKTVLLLSYAAIRDEWFTVKFRLALEHVNETQLEKVIIIFIEDIEDKDLPFVVRIFLSKLKPYLRWPDEGNARVYFWEQFLKLLDVNVHCDVTIPF